MRGSAMRRAAEGIRRAAMQRKKTKPRHRCFDFPERGREGLPRKIRRRHVRDQAGIPRITIPSLTLGKKPKKTPGRWTGLLSTDRSGYRKTGHSVQYTVSVYKRGRICWYKFTWLLAILSKDMSTMSKDRILQRGCECKD